MQHFTICNVCQSPGSLDSSTEIAKISSNVRFFKHERFTVWRCSNCQSLHSKEAIDLDFYYKHYVTLPNGFALSIAYQNRLKLLQKHGFDLEKRLLDFGCNQGFFVDFLKQSGYQNATGYDPYISSVSDPRLLTEKYDFVVSYDVIEHAESPRDFFEELLGCLKPGGIMVLGTPDASATELSDADLTSLHQPYHRHILSKQALLSLGEQHELHLAEYSNRSFYDTLIPGINFRAITYYIQKTGNLFDVVVEPLRFLTIFTSPLLIFYIFLGYFFRISNQITAVFKKTRQS